MVCRACPDIAACRKAKDCAAAPQRVFVAGPRFPADVIRSVHARHVATVVAAVPSDRRSETRRDGGRP
jgi:hypothetical protein